MKTQFTVAALLCTLTLGAVSASAMDSQTLLTNPDRYRVVSTQPTGIVYVDMDNLSSMQSRDYPSSIENISAKLYVEKYNPTIDDMTFEQGQTITQIDEYTAQIHGQKNANLYEAETTLDASYTPDGKELTPAQAPSAPTTFQQVQHLFLNLSRLARLGHS